MRRIYRSRQGKPTSSLIGEKDPLEKEVQLRIKTLYVSVGVHVYDTSQAFRAQITPGVPDLILFHGSHHWYHEVKKERGLVTDDQALFGMRCRNSGVPYLLGGLEVAEDHLRAIGIIK